ncbi:MAG TPA: M4 family metallopeptidase [Chryseolinea sp.]|nr:M4 family metallopeptidase [Chryseolinea sp.]
MGQRRYRSFFVPPYLSDEQARDNIFRARRTIKAELEARPSAAYIGTGETKRFIYDSNHTTFQQLKLVRKEGGAKIDDEVANTAYEYAGVIRNFYKRQLNLESFDNKGSDLIFNVHYGQDYNNAFWDGDEMTFGDGDGKMFTSFVNSLDVMGHELGHGVIQFTANLDYEKEPGALNEHFADVFGAAIKQSALKQTAAQANWLIGDTIVGPSFPGKAIRSMSAPGTAYEGDPQPAHMDQFYKGSDDYYGVHINSGIPNKVFSNVSVAITTPKAVSIWFTALKQLKFNADFQAFKAAINAAAKTAERNGEIPKGSMQHFTNAFAAVGM